MSERTNDGDQLAYRGGQPVVGSPRDNYTIGWDHAQPGWRHLTESEVAAIEDPRVNTDPLPG